MALRSVALRGLLVALLALWPAAAAAFSFLPGGFAPGEQILSIQLSSGGPTTPAVTYDTNTNTMVFSAEVSTITTTAATYDITLGDLLFQSTVMLVTENVIAPSLPFFGGQIGATLANGLVADFSILDVGPSGAGTLLDADYVAGLLFNASPSSVGLPVSGSLAGDFAVLGGDPGFVAAFGSAGNYFANLANFLHNGNDVGSDLCNLIVDPCVTGGEIDSFTVNPAATIVRTTALVPEPALAGLLLASAAALVLVRARRAGR